MLSDKNQHSPRGAPRNPPGLATWIIVFQAGRSSAPTLPRSSRRTGAVRSPVPSAAQNRGVGHDTSRERFPLEKEFAPGSASEFGLTKPQGTQLLVESAQPAQRPILCRRHSERGFEQSAEMGGIIETPPIGDLGYGGLGIRSV